MTVNSAGYQVEIPEYHTNLASKRYQIVHESLYLQKTLCDIVDLSKDWRLKSLNVAGHTLQWSSFQHSANLFFKCNTVQGLWSLCSEKKYADHVSKSTMSAPCLNQPTRERHGGEGLRLGVSWKRSQKNKARASSLRNSQQKFQKVQFLNLHHPHHHQHRCIYIYNTHAHTYITYAQFYTYNTADII